MKVLECLDVCVSLILDLTTNTNWISSPHPVFFLVMPLSIRDINFLLHLVRSLSVGMFSLMKPNFPLKIQPHPSLTLPSLPLIPLLQYCHQFLVSQGHNPHLPHNLHLQLPFLCILISAHTL